jgi:hypothetical protein
MFSFVPEGMLIDPILVKALARVLMGHVILQGA